MVCLLGHYYVLKAQTAVTRPCHHASSPLIAHLHALVPCVWLPAQMKSTDRSALALAIVALCGEVLHATAFRSRRAPALARSGY